MHEGRENRISAANIAAGHKLEKSLHAGSMRTPVRSATNLFVIIFVFFVSSWLNFRLFAARRQRGMSYMSRARLSNLLGITKRLFFLERKKQRTFTCLLVAAWCTPAAAQTVTLTPPQRDFGYFPGDLLSASATITIPQNAQLDPRTLPTPGPLTTSIDVRNVTLTQSPTQLRITITYQTFFAPEHISSTDIPGYSIAFLNNQKRTLATIPGFSITASLFRQDLTPVLDPAALKPDHPPPATDTAPTRTIALGAALAIIGALALLILHLWPFGLTRGPFAAAARAIPRTPPPANGEHAALLALHRAFDATAGARIMADDLAAFLARFPRFAALQPDIDRFFTLSRTIFFAPTPQTPLDWPFLWRLSRALAHAERTR